MQYGLAGIVATGHDEEPDSVMRSIQSADEGRVVRDFSCDAAEWAQGKEDSIQGKSRIGQEFLKASPGVISLR